MCCNGPSHYHWPNVLLVFALFLCLAKANSLPWQQWMHHWQTGLWQPLSAPAVEQLRTQMYPAKIIHTDQMDKWIWHVPEAPGMPPCRDFDRIPFCEILAGRNIVIMGDSMSGLFGRALLALASSSGRNLYEFPYTSSATNGTICEGVRPVRVSYLLANVGQDNLVNARSLKSRTMGRLAQCKLKSCKHPHYHVTEANLQAPIWGVDTFLEHLNATKDLIIVNMGVHHTDYRLQDHLRFVRNTLASIHAVAPESTVIWRNSATPHKNCHHLTGPLAAPVDRQWFAPQATKIVKQNNAVEQLISTEFPKVVYMDVAHATQFRADLHKAKDCIHYKLPSVANHWVRIFYNILLLMKNASIVPDHRR